MTAILLITLGAATSWLLAGTLGRRVCAQCERLSGGRRRRRPARTE
jgi:hypothetical protein